MNDIILWRPAYDASPPTWRIQLTLKEKALLWSEKRVSFSEKPDELFAANPRGQAPTLEDGQAAVFETNAILHYIEFAYPTPALMPPDAMLRATALTRIDEVSNYLMAAFLGFWRYRSSTPVDQRDPQVASRFVDGVRQEWQRWEDYLGHGSEPYFIGERLSLVDLSVFPYLASCIRNGLPVESAYPRLHAFYGHMKQRPSVEQTWPSEWRETTGEVMFA